MDALLALPAAWTLLGDDPLIVYPLAAAALLAFVSLFSGLGRLDFVALFRPATLLRLCAGVALGFLLVVVADLTALGPAGAVLGLARLPLYLLALAYGPTVGLFGGSLFAAATAAGPLPGWREALLILELTVLGWLALYPSPRAARWAGPFGAILAHVLVTGTAGVAFLAWESGSVTLAALLGAQRALLPGLVLAWGLLALVGPAQYARYLPHSRIAPMAGAAPGTRDARSVSRQRGEAPAEPLVMKELTRTRRRARRRLEEPSLPPEDPNG